MGTFPPDPIVAQSSRSPAPLTATLMFNTTPTTPNSPTTTRRGKWSELYALVRAHPLPSIHSSANSRGSTHTTEVVNRDNLLQFPGEEHCAANNLNLWSNTSSTHSSLSSYRSSLPSVAVLLHVDTSVCFPPSEKEPFEDSLLPVVKLPSLPPPYLLDLNTSPTSLQAATDSSGQQRRPSPPNASPRHSALHGMSTSFNPHITPNVLGFPWLREHTGVSIRSLCDLTTLVDEDDTRLLLQDITAVPTNEFLSPSVVDARSDHARTAPPSPFDVSSCDHARHAASVCQRKGKRSREFVEATQTTPDTIGHSSIKKDAKKPRAPSTRLTFDKKLFELCNTHPQVLTLLKPLSPELKDVLSRLRKLNRGGSIHHLHVFRILNEPAMLQIMILQDRRSLARTFRKWGLRAVPGRYIDYYFFSPTLKLTYERGSGGVRALCRHNTRLAGSATDDGSGGEPAHCVDDSSSYDARLDVSDGGGSGADTGGNGTDGRLSGGE